VITPESVSWSPAFDAALEWSEAGGVRGNIEDFSNGEAGRDVGPSVRPSKELNIADIVV
jgi:hypothetical protein